MRQPCSCEYCTQDRKLRSEPVCKPERVFTTADAVTVGAALLCAALTLAGVIAAWWVGR